MGVGIPAGTPKITQANASQFQKLVLSKRADNGANWFFWIAGLSLINSFSAFMGSGIRFIVGLGMTQITDMLAGGSKNPAALAFDFIAAGIFVGFGFAARKKLGWAFLLGMILYGLDTIIFVLTRQVVSILFHLFALYSLYRGFKASEQLTALVRLTETRAPTPIG